MGSTHADGANGGQMPPSCSARRPQNEEKSSEWRKPGAGRDRAAQGRRVTLNLQVFCCAGRSHHPGGPDARCSGELLSEAGKSAG